jgi:hypothetical protein
MKGFMMFKVNVGKRVLAVEFGYGTEPYMVRKNKEVVTQEAVTTTAYIIDITGKTKWGKEDALFSATVRHYSKDPFNKNVGRKNALKQALKGSFTREEREAFWNEYFCAHGRVD